MRFKSLAILGLGAVLTLSVACGSPEPMTTTNESTAHSIARQTATNLGYTVIEISEETETEAVAMPAANQVRIIQVVASPTKAKATSSPAPKKPAATKSASPSPSAKKYRIIVLKVTMPGMKPGYYLDFEANYQTPTTLVFDEVVTPTAPGGIEVVGDDERKSVDIHSVTGYLQRNHADSLTNP